MSDLIDRKEAVEAVTNEMLSWLEGDSYDYRKVVDAIMDLPTIDAVPVVRCKDCKHRIVNEHAGEKGYNNLKAICEYESDIFEFTLNNPLTEEQWDQIADVDFDNTDRIWFHTKHGKEVEFVKVRRGKWIPKEIMVHNYYAITGFKCSVCGEDALDDVAEPKTDYCPHCGARMDADDVERKEE